MCVTVHNLINIYYSMYIYNVYIGSFNLHLLIYIISYMFHERFIGLHH